MKTIITTLILLLSMQGIAQTTSKGYVEGGHLIYEDGKMIHVKRTVLALYPEELTPEEAEDYFAGKTIFKEFVYFKEYEGFPLFVRYEKINKKFHIKLGEKETPSEFPGYSVEIGVLFAVLLLYPTALIITFRRGGPGRNFRSMNEVRKRQLGICLCITIFLLVGFEIGVFGAVAVGSMIAIPIVACAMGFNGMRVGLTKGIKFALYIWIIVTVVALEVGGNGDLTAINKNWIVLYWIAISMIGFIGIELKHRYFWKKTMRKMRAKT